MRTRLSELDRFLDHHRELPVALRPLADVARVDPEFRERASAVRVLGEELVSVVVEVADQRNVQPSASRRCRIAGTAAAASAY
jgi:hypothetical protein